MIICILKGFWTTARNPRLVLLLWAWNLLLALSGAIPALVWFSGALSTSVETESLLTQFNVGAFADLSKYSEASPFSFLWASTAGVALIALVGSAFMNGGILEALGSEDDGRSLMHRFHRGGGHFFWRFIRLSAAAFTGVAMGIGIAAALRRKVMTPLSDSEWEPSGMFWGLVMLAATGLAALWFLLALDYARIRVARDGSRAMLPAYFGAMRFVARRAVATYGLAMLALGFLGALLVAYVAWETVWTASTWTAILALVGVQQIVVLARTGLRVTQVAAEREYFATFPKTAPSDTGYFASAVRWTRAKLPQWNPAKPSPVI
jgi:hypothetical protein